MIIKSIHISLKTSAILVIAAMLFLVSIFTWIVIAPRSISFINPYVEKELNSVTNDFNIKIGNSYIKWDSFNTSFGISVTDVVLMDDTKETLANFPEASFEFSIFNLLQGRILSSDVTLINPKIYLSLLNNELYVQQGTNKIDRSTFFRILSKKLKEETIKLPINSLKVRDAELFISNGVSDLLWDIEEGYITLNNLLKENKISSEFKIDFSGNKSSLNSQIYLNDNGKINIEVNFDNFPSYIASDLLPNTKITENIKFTSSGYFSLLFADKGDIETIFFDLKDTKGKIKFLDHFNDEIEISSFVVAGAIYDNFSTIELHNLESQIQNSSIKLSSKLELNNPLIKRKNINKVLPEETKKQDIDQSLNQNEASKNPAPNDFVSNISEISAEVEISNLFVNDLEKYWPLKLAPKVRKWITSNIKKGIVSKANGQFKFTHGDIKSIRENKHDKSKIKLADDAVKASVHVNGATVGYHSKYPKVNDVHATVNFTPYTMVANVDSGKIGESDVKNAKVTIDNMLKKPPTISIAGKYDGKIEDAIIFLKTALGNKYKNDTLQSIYNTSGSAQGDVFLSLPIKRKLKYDEMVLEINANTSNATLPAFLNGKDLTNTQFNVKFKDNKIDVTGKAGLNLAQKNRILDFSYHKDIKLKKMAKLPDASYNIKGIISPKDLANLKIANIPFIKNDFYFNINIDEKGKNKSFDLLANVKSAQISIPQISFEKKSGENGAISFTGHIAKDELDISNLKFKGDDFSVYGKLTVDKNSNEINSLDFNQVKFDKNDLSVSYKKTASGFEAKASGKSVDISSVISGENFKDTKDAKKSIAAQLDFDKIYMKNNETIQQFTANIDCSAIICNSVNIYGKMHDDNFVAASIKSLGDRSSLLVESDNAGALIRGLGISKHIEGGRLNLESTFARSANGMKVAKGVIKIRNFVAVKTPLLGKMLTLASLKGIGDLLNNKGITFEKFEAPFTMVGGVITVKDAKTSGSSVGITAEGDINTLTGELDLKGAVVPAYAVNKILGKIPLVGNLLIGKKDEGIIATTYKIKGKYEDAKVSVNPLTILTPGFLRNIFDIIP